MTLRSFISILELTDTATAEVKAYQLVGFTGAPVVAGDAPVKGFAFSPANAGEDFTVVALGTLRLKAQGAIVRGAAVVTVDADTVATAPGAAVNKFAIALTDAGDGDFVDILIR